MQKNKELTSAQTAELMFNFLRDTLYAPDKASLDPAELPEIFQDLGKGLVYFAQCVNEVRDFSESLSKGNLSTTVPSHANEIASSLKSLHASLRHLTWQTQQVAKGDYSQKVDFMGEFSDAFNDMIHQLDESRKALLEEIAVSREKTQALEQSNSLFEAVTDKSSQCIIVRDRESGEILFTNHTAKTHMAGNDSCSRVLHRWLEERSEKEEDDEYEEEVTINEESLQRVLSISAYPILWRARSAYAYVVSDVSQERKMVAELSNAAYQDNLTGLRNRHFGMQSLRKWLEEKRHFSLGFIDIDNLKYVNDNYGHNEGDLYIRGVADLLSDAFPQGVVSRLGGDEFMVLLDGSYLEHAENDLQAIRARLVETSDDGPDYRRSISFGVVEVLQDNDASVSDLLSLADERMYRFKRAHKMHRRE